MKNNLIRNIIIICFTVFSLSTCSQIDTEWHRNKNRTPEVEKGYEEHFKLISDGWKIIGKSETKGRLGWGWEATIADVYKGMRLVVVDPETKFEYETVRRLVVEYVLIDKDGFEIVNSIYPITLPNKETVSIKTTSTISRIDAKRVTGSICKIRIE